ncbi:MAG TPA: hypothetical protein VFJ87_00650 [Rhodanobacteraceae bacterium]|nr:hypothetical protein [Rhodanobacteraceae bacterium]
MKSRTLPLIRLMFPALAPLVLAMGGCNSASAPDSTAHASASAEATAATNANDPRIDLNCTVSWLQQPPGAFHYSYSKTGSNPVTESVDLTPQAIDGHVKNGTVDRDIHGVASDSDGWRQAQAFLMAITGMSSTIALVNNSSAMVREGNEKLNGYDTIRYSIDTARANAAEAALYRTTLGQGGYERGTAWVTSQGCPIKISLDTKSYYRNGEIDSIRYEVAIVKQPRQP